MGSKKIFLLILIIFSTEINSQAYLNLDFEKGSIGDLPDNWRSFGRDFTFLLDTKIFYSGEKSLCITSGNNGGQGFITATFPIKKALGKKIKYSGYIKTEKIKDGYAGLWWRVNENKELLSFNDATTKDKDTKNEWHNFEVEFNVPLNATSLSFGVILKGKGKAWFDNLKIELDGESYLQKEPEIIKLSLEQINWLKRNVNSFDTAEPRDDDSDLNFLEEMVGNAKIVSLGEGTHGTSEFFKMKHRIVKYLVKNMGFNVFAIEANMPEAVKVNNYIINGIGDPKEALADLYFWTWNTQEVLDMIEWMRYYNKSGNEKVEFYGFDMQVISIAVNNVKYFLKNYDSKYYEEDYKKLDKLLEFEKELKKVNSRLSNIFIEPYLHFAEDVYKHMIESENMYSEFANQDTVKWYVQNSRIIVQGIEARMTKQISRDENMALNVKWILDNMPKDTKIILWAHNLHVTKKEFSSEKRMGAYLNEIYGNDMLVMGFGFNKGEYTAVGEKGLGVYSTSLAEPGSIEFILHELNIPRLVLDLRKVKESNLSPVFENTLMFRNIGSVAQDYSFFDTIITDEFDILIYFEETNPTNCFGVPVNNN